MKQFILVLPSVLFFYFQSFVFSQDKVILTNGNEIEAQVTEISKSEIRYKEYSNPDGPDYVIKKNKVNKIILKNGEEKIFAGDKKNMPFGRNIIAYHMFDVIYNDFSLSYERITKNGKLGVKIPFAIGYNTDNLYGPRDYMNIAYTGVGFNIYPIGHHTVSYFMGPELHIGIGKSDTYNYYNYYPSRQTEEFLYGRLIINNGVSYNPIPNFRVATVLGLGIRYYDLPDSYNNGFHSTAYISISMGYRF
ncbi:MAG: hypothetical protein K8R37_01875 [Bacteroidales bacterium]|nr:hypothetical protein [Bacteroidales bacterium]